MSYMDYIIDTDQVLRRICFDVPHASVDIGRKPFSWWGGVK